MLLGKRLSKWWLLRRILSLQLNASRTEIFQSCPRIPSLTIRQFELFPIHYKIITISHSSLYSVKWPPPYFFPKSCPNSSIRVADRLCPLLELFVLVDDTIWQSRPKLCSLYSNLSVSAHKTSSGTIFLSVVFDVSCWGLCRLRHGTSDKSKVDSKSLGAAAMTVRCLVTQRAVRVKVRDLPPTFLSSLSSKLCYFLFDRL